MVAAIVGTLLQPEIEGFQWIALGIIIGTAIGVPLSWVPLTAVPQRTALSHAFGGLAGGLDGISEFTIWHGEGALTSFRVGALVFEVVLGLFTFT